MKTFISLLRPSHWIKNVLIFVPIIFAKEYNLLSFDHAVIAWVAFSLIASSVYIINDIFDKKADQLHPDKKKRVIASGKVPVPLAIIIAAVLVGASLTISWYVHALLLVAIYFVLNLLYSLVLKRVLILDVMIIAIGFVLRILVGTVAIHVTVSHWILICTFFVSLFLGFGKRKNENLVLMNESKGHRKVLEYYTESFLNQLLGISAAITILAYALYTIDPQTIAHFGTDNLIYTVPIVVYGIFHYFHLLYNHARGGDPTKVFLKDLPTIITIFVWLVSVILIIR